MKRFPILLSIFALFFCLAAARAETVKNTTLRGSYSNSQFVFETTGHGRVAFLGGSITEMDGYRPMVCEFLQERFPKTEFDFVAAGISSTCSDTGAFRLESDVLAHGPIDLFFLEFSVNDDQDGHFSLEHAIRGFEGVVRHIRTECPNVDIVVTFFVNENLMARYRAGDEAVSIQAHRRVAEHYGISTINLAKEIQEEIDAKQITWQEFGGVHPAPRGNRICTEMIKSVLNEAWKTKATAVKPHEMPAQIDPWSYVNGSFRGFDCVKTDGFQISVPDWKNIPGGFRGRFGGRNLLWADQPGATCEFQFVGKAVGLYVLAGPDSGKVEFSIDGGEFRSAEVHHAYSTGLHYPRTVMLADELERGQHTVTLRIPGENCALRILEICVGK
ncbi:MAG: SGNH/GDSL hydrolase family protein [Thermoguttaceae bacterium]|nr:SGNH/GDSL hydrolase family protein [Thermoguttaceae bacterium]